MKTSFNFKVVFLKREFKSLKKIELPTNFDHLIIMG